MPAFEAFHVDVAAVCVVHSEVVYHGLCPPGLVLMSWLFVLYYFLHEKLD